VGNQGLVVFIALFLPTAWLSAGDITGTMAVPKPDQAMVYVEKAAGTFKSDRAEMDQQSKVFIPYALPVLQGTTVVFKNGDSLQHNVFGVGAEEFNLGNWTKGVTREHTFNKTGDVTVLCNVHPEMEGHILVLQNPYFARPDAQGKYNIAGIPPGDYVVRAWYRGKTKKQDVKVPASGSVAANF
jgi:plastocyanin